MTYKKVFTSSRYHSKGQNSFALEPKLKRLLVGGRDIARARPAYLGKVIEQGKTANILDLSLIHI